MHLCDKERVTHCVLCIDSSVPGRGPCAHGLLPWPPEVAHIPGKPLRQLSSLVSACYNLWCLKYRNDNMHSPMQSGNWCSLHR